MGIIQFIEKVCVQTAVYWGNPQAGATGGMTFDAPVEIACRWDDRVEVISNSKGKEVVSKAQVLVTQDLDEQGYLYLGSLSGLGSNPNPLEIDDAYEIARMDKSPLFKSTTEFVRMVYLSKSNQ